MTTTLRRGYFDCRFGQLHVHLAIPAGGGFEEATTLLCIPGEPGSGRFFRPLLEPLGADRSIYAVDLPGRGESDPPPGNATPAQLAGALKDFLDNMRIRRVDLLAYGEGTAVALAMVQQYPSAVGHVAVLSDDGAPQGSGALSSHAWRNFPLPAGNPPIAADPDLAPALRDFFGSRPNP
jgi:pimeloyl-ACP methyl ester carboxylesterase